MNHIYVAFYTRNTPYEKEIEKLIESLEKFNLEYIIKDYESRKDWLKNIHYKPECILDVMNDFPNKNIVYTDADSVIKQIPKLFFNTKADIMAHIRENRRNDKLFINGEILSGTLYFANNERAIRFVKEWVIASNKNIGEITEQHLLQMMFNNERHIKLGIEFEPLPAEYCCIPVLMNNIVPVIEHHQLSRTTRKWFNIKSQITVPKKKVFELKNIIKKSIIKKEVTKQPFIRKFTKQPFVRRFIKPRFIRRFS